MVEQSENFFHRFGTWAVFFARFVPPIRAFVPVTAGALGMPPARFYAINIPAILVWAPAHVLPGVLAVSVLHEYAGLHHHGHVGKHIWILTRDRRRDRFGPGGLDLSPPERRRRRGGEAARVG